VSYFVLPMKMDPEMGLVADLPLNKEPEIILLPKHKEWCVCLSSELSEMQQSGSLPNDVTPTRKSLVLLLESATAYPPALVLTREELSKHPQELNREEFLLKAEERLRYHYSNQANAGFVLAETVASDTAHFPNGLFCWILGPSSSFGLHHREPSVMAISADLQLYSTPARFWAMPGESRKPGGPKPKDLV